ncbi:AAA family ATPase [Prosthecobacter sp.]|uniref:AAA family ATPase n=1 Tax=Prosthecobacter sp. TaxID=1965333 RepID=UPI003783DD4D
MKSKKKPRAKGSPLVAPVLQRHFKTRSLHDLVTCSRLFPLTARADLQTALEAVMKSRSSAIAQMGVHQRYSHEKLSFATLAQLDGDAPTIGPLQHEEIDTGGPVPVRCLTQCLWLCEHSRQRFALLLSPATSYGRNSGLHIEIAQLGGTGDATLGQQLIQEIEKHLALAQSYRGKVISLEQLDDYSGKSGGVKVHKLRSVSREQVILPDRTLRLLERNVTDFIQQRDRLKDLNMSLKKGLLFYGPPGTGKTHTIHYLASQLPDHTTLLITAQEVGLLTEYMQLARFLQPAMVVLEDVDLIARSRTKMRGGCEESLLNKLLNEMDGLREDAMLLFILTTNRPQDLEEALASRPGRVDQAIEFPLPDEDGRRKLIRLYAGKLKLSDRLVTTLVRKTKNSSAAFIKELMRRSAQFLTQAGGSGELSQQHVEEALDEMLFAGGSLNVKLLGGASS